MPISDFESRLDRLHAQARAHPVLQRLAVISRILLALAFVPTGMVKVLGEPFTSMSTETPIGYFFDAMYSSGFYWEFLGWGQVLAGVLLLVPRTATLGAVLFFPIVLNIFAITVALHFRGTPFITGLMLLACVFLLCWDYDRLKPIVWPRGERYDGNRPARFSTLERWGYALGTIAGLAVLGGTRGLVPAPVVRVSLPLGAVAVLLVLVAWLRALRGARTDARPA
jgi:uncharacterized membrane protein YphA (DoxX/SURF4 family)